MIFGIYIKRKPEKKWSLVATAIYADVAEEEASKQLKIAKFTGLDSAETIVQPFPNMDSVPGILKSVKSPSLIYS